MYLTLKSLHIIFVVTWFAALFYIFRLFVYHRINSHQLELTNIFCVMERRLLYYICLPSSFIVATLGTLMIIKNPALIFQTWLIIKLILVIFLFAYQYLSFYTYREFKRFHFYLSEKQCRFINEVPSVLLILIVFLAVFKFG